MTELADIFQQYGDAYRRMHHLSKPVLKAMNAIESCRTSKLGGHVDECDKCGHQKISYNSCRNRHCPKCQSFPKEKWLEDRKNDLLPVPYFHVVFTIPNILNTLALQNKKKIYALLLKSSSETLLELGEDPKHLGAKIGFISILHTWGQNLLDHPHVHCIVTGGGLSLDETRWISAKHTFFLPVKIMSRLFRGKFLASLKRLHKDGELKRVNDNEFQEQLDELYMKEWVVYCKPPFKNPENVLNYFGRYTHKVAISNHRIYRLTNEKVTFKWKDYKDNNQDKLMTLAATEFIRRFLLHILPPGFVKIRHYGILSNRNRKIKLQRCKELLGVQVKIKNKSKEKWNEFLLRITGTDPLLCSICKKGHFVPRIPLAPACCSPPTPTTSPAA
jgi:hypothetical protein